MKVFDEVVGENVRRLRVANGLSQADLAARMGDGGRGEPVHQQTILKIEKGTRPLKFSEAVRMAEVLSVELPSLTSVTEEGLIEAELVSLLTRWKNAHADVMMLGERIAPLVKDLAQWIRTHEGSNLADPEMIDAANEALYTDWGEQLQRALRARGASNADA